MRNNKLFSKIMSAAAVLGMTVGILGMAFHVEAANLEKTRGRVNVDLEDFTLVESTISDTDRFGLVSKNAENSRYELHFENSFTDRNKIGCTYRSTSKFDLTDVTHIEFYAYAQQNEDDNKFLIYVDPSSNTYYHRKDRDTITNDLVAGDGGVWKQSSLYYSPYGTNPQDYKAKINARYSSEYVFVGLSHQWFVHDAKIFLDNKTVTSTTSGCINLKLKSHDITLLEPQQPKRVNADGTMSTYTAFGNLRLGLATGNYDPGETSNVYRDEKVVLQYTLAGDSDAPAAKLTQFKFYSDANKKNLIYTMNVSGSDKQCEFTFNSSLIKNLEKGNAGSLGAIYLEPVFETQNVNVDFSTVVPEVSGEVEVVKKNEKSFVLREKASLEEIGTFALNGARKIGDTFTVRYTPNANYTGNYEFSYYNYRECESSNQVSGAVNNWATYNPEKTYDIEVTLNDTYFWLSAHVGLMTEVSLSDKEATFNNQYVSIDEAVVKVVNGIQPTGEIKYTYYTDAECKNEMGELPINAGTYYVIATMAQDDNYRSVKSNVAVLTINKAVPKLSLLKGSAIVYGQSIGESVPSGKAEGVVKASTVEGIFKWSDTVADIVPDKAGTTTAEVEFIPTGVYEANYTTAAGMAKVTVNKADPVVTLDDMTVTYTGRAVEVSGAEVKGIYGEATGQKVSYDYYSDENCKKKLSGVPVDAGTYYVLAKASSNTNYNYKKMEVPAVYTINPRIAQLIQVPLGQITSDNIYRVYVTNPGYVGPEGTIDLSLIVSGEVKGTTGPLEIQQDDAGRYYAQFVYEDVKDIIGENTLFEVKAEYNGNNNYLINPNELVMKSAEEGKVSISKTIELSYDGISEERNILEDLEVDGDDWSITWLNLDELNADDVADFEISDDKKSLTVTPQNAGNAVVFAYVSDTYDSYYVSYVVNVKPADVELSLNQSEVYSAQPKWADRAEAVYETGNGEKVNITDELIISQEYYTDEALTNKIEDPVNAQVYYVRLQSSEQRNYNVSESVGIFTITPAELTTRIEDKTVFYDGKEHVVEEAVISGLLGEDTMDDLKGSVEYKYNGQVENIPVNAGTYNVVSTYIPAAEDNYKDEESFGEAALKIEQIKCTIEYTGTNKVYDANPVVMDPDKFVITGIDGKVLEGEEKADALHATTLYYRSLMDGEYTTEAPVNAGVYAVYAQKEAAGNYKAAVSKSTLFAIEKAELEIAMESEEIEYTGRPVNVSSTVEGLYGTDSVEVQYIFFEDEDEHILMDEVPVNAGTYYVRPFIPEQQNYKRRIGDSRKINVSKATPVILNVQATELVYGDELGTSIITGTAAGVNDEVLTGVFGFSEAIEHEVRPGGEYVVDITFIPTGEAEWNYKEAYTTVGVKVNPIEPVMSGKDKKCVYNGQTISLEPVSVTGPEGLAAPEGNITYEYYKDADLSNFIGTEGVKDAGTYYCKVSFESLNACYTSVSKIYKLEVDKADAAIGMYQKYEKIDDHTVIVTLHGVLAGVFDNPTGTVDIYKRAEGKDDPYVLTEANSLIVQEENGVYMFQTDVIVESNEVYDFKAVYNAGTSDNYNVLDGELTGVDTDKEPQHIYFEEAVINKVYGEDDFTVKVLDENDGNGKVTYRAMDAINKEGIISVTADGTIKILGTGKAFCVAVKEETDTHAAAVAIVCINVSQAPVELELADMTTTYNGKKIQMHKPVITSNGRTVSENEEIALVYTYIHKETGIILSQPPIDAGEYEVIVSSMENDHYYGSTESAFLTIEKAKSSMVLKVEKIDETNKKILLQGTLPGVFDDPTGTITLYQKLRNQPEAEYKIVAEEIVIHQNDDDTSYFVVETDVDLDAVYDFKAAYVEGPSKNYVISDGEFTDVNPEKIIEEQEKDKKPGGGKTGDSAHTMLYMMMFSSLLAIIATKKYTRR